MSEPVKNQYQERWESRSSIRTRPRKIIDFSRIGDFFPVNKQFLLLLPEIASLGEQVREAILVQTFYKYLNDIIHLEMKWIHTVCHNIIHKNMAVAYSEQTKLNAYTVIIDEYYHNYMAHDMTLQLRHQFPELPELYFAQSDSYSAIVTIKNRLEEKYHDIFEIIAVCIFETTLVRELIEYFDCENIHPSIKYYINDHMNDEARHYVFFYDVLCQTWENLPEDFKKNIGIHLADFVKLHLNIHSEKDYNQQLLSHILSDSEKAKAMVNELYRGFVISPEIPIVKNVLNVLKKSGILDNEHVKISFQINNLYL